MLIHAEQENKRKHKMYDLLGLQYLIWKLVASQGLRAGRWVVQSAQEGFRTQRIPGELFVRRGCPLAPSPSSVRLPDHSHQLLLHRREGSANSKAGNSSTFQPVSHVAVGRDKFYKLKWQEGISEKCTLEKKLFGE